MVKIRSRLSSVGPFLLVLALVPLLLSGCYVPERGGPVDVSAIDGKLALAFCVDETIASITIEQVSPGQDRHKPWTQLWSADGPKKVHAGDVIVVGDAVEGLEGKAEGEFDPSEGTSYFIHVYDSPSGEYGPVINAPEGGVKEGKWVSGTGKVTSAPCEGI